jgi:hypothetical protein
MYWLWRWWDHSTGTAALYLSPELLFTELILHILYWIYEIDIHSCIFLLVLPNNIDFLNLYYFFFLGGGNWVISFVGISKTMDLAGTMHTKKKRRKYTS